MFSSCTLVTLMLAVSCLARNETHFDLYKNSHFGPCPATAPIRATSPIPDPSENGLPTLPTNGSLSAAAFCGRFWNYTVLPTTPEDGAFGPTWLSTFSKLVLWAIAYGQMLFWHKEHEFDSGPSLELYMLDRSLKVAVKDPEEDCVPSPKRNYIWETPLYRSEPPKSWIHCLRTKMAFSSLKVEMRRMITFSKVKLALVLSLSILTTALGWHSFVTLVAHPTSSQSFLSPIAVLDLVAYFVTLREDIPLHIYYYLRWPLLAASIVQALASAVALWFYYHISFSAPQYAVSPAFDLSPYTPRCDVRALLYDPTLGSYFATYGALPTIVAYAMFIIAFAFAAYQRFKPTYIVWALMTANALAATFDLVMLVIMALRPKHPVAWDPVCGLVHVMMSNRRGYVDVPGSNKWQTVKMFFTVIS